MSRTPFSLRPNLPALNLPGIVYVAAHLVGEVEGLQRRLHPDAIDALLARAISDGWSVNLRDANPRKLILTFDDGRRFSDGLAAALDRHGASAIFFVCTEREIASYTPGEPHYWELTPENRRYIAAHHVIGGHTHRHVDLRALPAAGQAAVLGDSARLFRSVYGFAPWCFAYPWGRYRGATLGALQTLGVRYAFIAGAGRLPTHDLLIPRVLLDNGDWPDGSLEFVLRQSAGVANNAKLLLRNAHAVAFRVARLGASVPESVARHA